MGKEVASAIGEKQKKKTVRDDKVSLPWHEDIAILQRLEAVGSMMAQGAQVHQIAVAFSYTVRTAYRDCARVRELWKMRSLDTVEQSRLRSIANYRTMQSYCWQMWRETQNKTEKLSFLREIRELESKIVELEGTKAPTGIDLTTQGQKIAFSAKDLSDAELADIISRNK